MPRKRYKPEKIIAKLRDAVAGLVVRIANRFKPATLIIVVIVGRAVAGISGDVAVAVLAERAHQNSSRGVIPSRSY